MLSVFWSDRLVGEWLDTLWVGIRWNYRFQGQISFVGSQRWTSLNDIYGSSLRKAQISRSGYMQVDWGNASCKWQKVSQAWYPQGRSPIAAFMPLSRGWLGQNMASTVAAYTEDITILVSGQFLPVISERLNYALLFSERDKDSKEGVWHYKVAYWLYIPVVGPI